MGSTDEETREQKQEDDQSPALSPALNEAGTERSFKRARYSTPTLDVRRSAMVKAACEVARICSSVSPTPSLDGSMSTVEAVSRDEEYAAAATSILKPDMRLLDEPVLLEQPSCKSLGDTLSHDICAVATPTLHQCAVPQPGGADADFFQNIYQATLKGARAHLPRDLLGPVRSLLDQCAIVSAEKTVLMLHKMITWFQDTQSGINQTPEPIAQNSIDEVSRSISRKAGKELPSDVLRPVLTLLLDLVAVAPVSVLSS